MIVPSPSRTTYLDNVRKEVSIKNWLVSKTTRKTVGGKRQKKVFKKQKKSEIKRQGQHLKLTMRRSIVFIYLVLSIHSVNSQMLKKMDKKLFLKIFLFEDLFLIHKAIRTKKRSDNTIFHRQRGLTGFIIFYWQNSSHLK